MKGWVFGPVIALVASASTLCAQRVFGTVVLPDGRSPGSGAIVAAADSTGSVVARELTSVRGDYVMPLPRPGRYTLTVWRVGSEPEMLPDVVVGGELDVRLRIVLAQPAPRPAPVSARSGETCNVAQSSGPAGVLWQQLQVALSTTAMAELTRSFVATWGYSERLVAPNRRDTVSRSDRTERMGLEDPTMPVLSADSSQQRGFVLESSQGVMYHVPGIATLRSAAFTRRRCFAQEPAPADRPGWIGLHFRPEAVRTGLSDIEGTIWFDGETLEPIRMEYLYGGLPATFAPARAGGAIAFRRVPTGHWVADEWMIRVPSGRYFRTFAYDTPSARGGYGNISLDGIRITTATLASLVVNGATIYRKP